MTALDPATALAVLEEQPYSSDDLAALLTLERDAVHRLLLGLQREGRVKRVGSAQRWALPAYVAPTGRKPQVDRVACRAAIHRVLAGTALATEDLVLRTGYGKNVIKHECGLLFEAGALSHFGVGRGSRWSLPGYVAPVVPAPAPIEHFRVPPPSASSARPFQTHAARDVAAATEKRAARADGSTSWWASFADPTLPREAFTAAAQSRDAEMCATNQAWRRQNLPQAMNRPQTLLKQVLS